MQLNKDILDRLWYAQNYMGYEEFYNCFHTNTEQLHQEHGLSKHLWIRYKKYGHNILDLWRYLDLGNRQKLLTYLQGEQFDKDYRKGMCIED